jgi:two-component system chemotaxis response regulator CheB
MTANDDPGRKAARGHDRYVHRDMVTIGASAGGVEALSRLMGMLPSELPASVFVVLHLLPTGTSVLPAILDRRGNLPCASARDGEPIERGRVYVAPPDQHMLIDDGHVSLTRGPRENGLRPAVDPLFRSAARAYRERVVGVVLSGALDDGTDGLRFIQARGGVALVQDPREALYPGMPQSAIEHNAVDQIVPLAEMADAICRLLDTPTIPHMPPPDQIEDEPEAADRSDDAPTAGALTGLTCPECGGALWEDQEHGFPRFKCHVGHAYSPASLQSEQGEALEGALWAALRSMQERGQFYRRLARRQEPYGERMLEKASICDEHANVLRRVITSIGREPGDESEETEAAS